MLKLSTETWVLIVAYMYIFYVFYILAMGVYRAFLTGRLSTVAKVLLFPIVALAILIDVACQYTIATIVFKDLPVAKEYMVTERLSRYVKDGEGWRFKIASFICENMLDIFDPSGDHC